jgi:hypothetical protein
MRVWFTQLGLHLWSSNIIGITASTIGKPLYIKKWSYTKSTLVFDTFVLKLIEKRS